MAHQPADDLGAVLEAELHPNAGAHPLCRGNALRGQRQDVLPRAQQSLGRRPALSPVASAANEAPGFLMSVPNHVSHQVLLNPDHVQRRQPLLLSDLCHEAWAAAAGDGVLLSFVRTCFLDRYQWPQPDGHENFSGTKERKHSSPNKKNLAQPGEDWTQKAAISSIGFASSQCRARAELHFLL